MSSLQHPTADDSEPIDETGLMPVALPLSRPNMRAMGGYAIFGGATIFTTIWLMALGRGLTFYYDD